MCEAYVIPFLFGLGLGCVKRMSSRSCLGHFSQFAIPTLMYIS